MDDCCHMTQVSPGLGVYTSLGVIIPVLSDCGLQTIEILFTFHSHTLLFNIESRFLLGALCVCFMALFCLIL